MPARRRNPLVPFALRFAAMLAVVIAAVMFRATIGYVWAFVISVLAIAVFAFPFAID